MRITDTMMSNNFLRDLDVNLNNMKKIKEQLNSGKQVRRPSDDPFKVARTMQLHTQINANKQYNTNIKDTKNWLDITDTTLGQMGDVLHRVRELLVSSGNASYTDNERLAIKDEIKEKVSEFAQILNTNFDGKYIYGGTRVTTKPVEIDIDLVSGESKLVYYKKGGGVLKDLTGVDKVEYTQITQKLKIEISQDLVVDYNVNAKDVLEFENSIGKTLDIRDIFSEILNHLEGKNDDGTAPADNNAKQQNVAKLIKEDLQNITDAMDSILKVRSEVGAKENRMDSAKKKNEEQNFNMTDILSKTEDIDFAEKSIEFSTMKALYMATLQTSAQVLQPTLLDYLR